MFHDMTTAPLIFNPDHFLSFWVGEHAVDKLSQNSLTPSVPPEMIIHKFQRFLQLIRRIPTVPRVPLLPVNASFLVYSSG
jgi:hypothetical protein